MGDNRVTSNAGRQYWLWVVRPEYYLGEDGKELEELDPENEIDPGGWWTCHRDTRKGDLSFVWRTRPKSDIGYLMQAASDAYPLADDRYARKRGWKYGCDFKVLYKFQHPVSIQDLHQDPYLQDWGAYKALFRGITFRIPPNHWEHLNRLAAAANAGYEKFLQIIRTTGLSPIIRQEEELEEALAQNLSLLKSFGYALELYSDPETGKTGRQLVCTGSGGRIDLLGYDRRKKRYVVIELKNVKAGQKTFAQIANYVGWVQDNIAGRKPVVGLVISRGYDRKFANALKITDRIFQLDVEKLGFQ
jgi:hypothetical protein